MRKLLLARITGCVTLARLQRNVVQQNAPYANFPSQPRIWRPSMAQAIVDVTEQQRLNLAREAGSPGRTERPERCGSSCCYESDVQQGETDEKHSLNLRPDQGAEQALTYHGQAGDLEVCMCPCTLPRLFADRALSIHQGFDCSVGATVYRTKVRLSGQVSIEETESNARRDG